MLVILKCIIVYTYYFTIYLFIYIFIYIFKKEFTKVKRFQWLCGKKKNKREAGANEQPGLTKFKVESPPRWDLRVFLVYRFCRRFS